MCEQPLRRGARVAPLEGARDRRYTISMHDLGHFSGLKRVSASSAVTDGTTPVYAIHVRDSCRKPELMNVLIVDDEPLARERLARLVGQLDGYRVLEPSASNGEEALTLIDSLKPDIVLLDIRMPRSGRPPGRGQTLRAGSAAGCDLLHGP